MQHKGLKTLYVSGEESQQQIRMRADRIMPRQRLFAHRDLHHPHPPTPQNLGA